MLEVLKMPKTSSYPLPAARDGARRRVIQLCARGPYLPVGLREEVVSETCRKFVWIDGGGSLVQMKFEFEPGDDDAREMDFSGVIEGVALRFFRDQTMDRARPSLARGPYADFAKYMEASVALNGLDCLPDLSG